MCPLRRSEPMSRSASRHLTRMAADAGEQVRDARLRREWTIAELGRRAGLGVGTVHRVESGGPATPATSPRRATVLALRPALDLAPGRPAGAASRRPRDAEDLVHAAMGELEAGALE